LDLIKKVQITDHDHFTDFGFFPAVMQNKGLNTFGIVDMKGENWKKTKRLVTPPFSLPRLKKTVPAMNDCARKLIDYLHSQEHKEVVDGCSSPRNTSSAALPQSGLALKWTVLEKRNQVLRKIPSRSLI